MSSLKLTAAPLNINGFYNMKFPAILQLVPCFPIFQEVYSPLVFREGYIANVHGVMSMLKAPQLSHCFAYHLEILTVQPLQVLLFFGFPGSLCENQTSKNNIGLKLQSRFFRSAHQSTRWVIHFRCLGFWTWPMRPWGSSHGTIPAVLADDSMQPSPKHQCIEAAEPPWDVPPLRCTRKKHLQISVKWKVNVFHQLLSTEATVFFW